MANDEQTRTVDNNTRPPLSGFRAMMVVSTWLAILAFAAPPAAADEPTIDVGFEVVSLAFSPNDKLLAAAGIGGLVHLYETETNQLERELHIPFPQQNIDKQEAEQRCDHVLFSPDGRHLAGLFSGEWDFVRGPDTGRINFFGLTRGIVIWNPNTGRINKTIELGRRVGMLPEGAKKVDGVAAAGALDSGLTREQGIHAIAFADSGKRIIGDLGHIHIVKRGGGGDGALNQGKDKVLLVAAAGPDDRRVTVSPRGAVKFWDRDNAITSKAKAKAQANRLDQSSLKSIAVAADGSRMAIGAVDGIRLFDMAQGKATKGIRTNKKKLGAAMSVALSPDGTQLASAHEKGTIKIWDPATREELKEFALGKDAPQPLTVAVAFSSDGKTLAYARDGRVELIDTSNLPAK